METQQALKGLTQSLINMLVGTTTGPGFFFLPLITLFFVLRFLRWIVSSARGTSDYEGMSSQVAEYQRRAGEAAGRVRGSRRRY